MGASEWYYVEPYQGSCEATLAELCRRVLADGDFEWWDSAPKPTTMDEFRAYFPSSEEDWMADEPMALWTEGTHSILDLPSIARRGSRSGGLMLLTAEESAKLFGSERPTADDFAAHRDDRNDYIGRYDGYCVLLYDVDASADAVPTAVGFWGITGD